MAPADRGRGAAVAGARRRPGPTVADTLRASGALLRSAWTVRRSGTGLTRLAAAAAGRNGASPADPAAAGASNAGPGEAGPALHRARRLAAAVDRAGRLLPLSTPCLVRALALRRLLEARGLDDARVRIGVRRREGRFDAHAWVEYRGRTLGEAGDRAAGFTPLDGVEVGPGS